MQREQYTSLKGLSCFGVKYWMRWLNTRIKISLCKTKYCVLSHTCSILLVITRLQFFEAVAINRSQTSGHCIHCWFQSQIQKKVIMWWQIMWWVHLCRQESCFTVCLQVCWFSHFLAQYNPIYVTEKSSTDAKSITWILFAFCLQLLRNLQQLYCKLWSRDVSHEMITFQSATETNSTWNGLKNAIKFSADIISYNIGTF